MKSQGWTLPTRTLLIVILDSGSPIALPMLPSHRASRIRLSGFHRCAHPRAC